MFARVYANPTPSSGIVKLPTSARFSPWALSARVSVTIHADRGASMRSKPVALLLADLGVSRHT